MIFRHNFRARDGAVPHGPFTTPIPGSGGGRAETSGVAGPAVPRSLDPPASSPDLTVRGLDGHAPPLSVPIVRERPTDGAMENTASLGETDVQSTLARYAPPEPPTAAESAASRVSRIGGRTARRVLVTDLGVLGLASLAVLAPRRPRRDLAGVDPLGGAARRARDRRLRDGLALRDGPAPQPGRHRRGAAHRHRHRLRRLRLAHARRHLHGPGARRPARGPAPGVDGRRHPHHPRLPPVDPAPRHDRRPGPAADHRRGHHRPGARAPRRGEPRRHGGRLHRRRPAAARPVARVHPGLRRRGRPRPGHRVRPARRASSSPSRAAPRPTSSSRSATRASAASRSRSCRATSRSRPRTRSSPRSTASRCSTSTAPACRGARASPSASSTSRRLARPRHPVAAAPGRGDRRQGDLARPGLLRAGAPRPQRQGLQDVEVPHDGAGRGGLPDGPGPPQRARRVHAALQDPQGPPRHEGGRASCGATRSTSCRSCSTWSTAP